MVKVKKKNNGGSVKDEFMAVKKIEQKKSRKAPRDLTTSQKMFLARKRQKDMDRIQAMFDKEDAKTPGPPMKKAEGLKKEKEKIFIRTGKGEEEVFEKTPGRNKMGDKSKPDRSVKKEREKDSQRIERIKKTQAQEDAAFSKKQKESRAAGQSVLKKGIRKNKQFIGKKMNMGGVMKNRGGTFKGTF